MGRDVLCIAMLSGRTRQAKDGIIISSPCQWLRVLWWADGAKLIAITDESQRRSICPVRRAVMAARAESDAVSTS